MHKPSEKLANGLTLQMIDIRLIHEGREALEKMECYCVFDVGDEGVFTSLWMEGQMDEVLTLSYLLMGVKFSSDSLIVGNDVAQHLPSTGFQLSTDTPLTHLAQCGSRRSHAMRLLNDRIWTSLSNVSLDDLAVLPASQVRRFVGVMHLATCAIDQPEDEGEMEKVRKLTAWAAKEAVGIVDAPESTKQDRSIMAACGAKLAFREGYEAMTLGLPSLVSDDVFDRATGAKRHAPCTVVDPSHISGIFDGPRRSTTGDYQLQRYIRNVLIPPALRTLSQIVRNASINVQANLRRSTLCWWQSLDQLFGYFDQLSREIKFHPAARLQQNEESVSILLRAVSFMEQVAMEVEFLLHRLLKGKMAHRPDDECAAALLKISDDRLRSSIRRMSCHMKHIMESRAVLGDAYHVLTVFSRNLGLLGSALEDMSSHLLHDESNSLIHGLQFAAFYDDEAAAIADILARASAKAIDASAVRMVSNVLDAMIEETIPLPQPL